MKNIIKQLACFIMLTYSVVQAQVNINTIIIPPTSANINDFNSLSKINVMFTNVSSSTTLSGYPQLKLTGNNGITLTSINSPGLYNSSILIQNVPTNITSAQLNQLFSINNLIISGMNAEQQLTFREIGELPDGVYSLCIEMWSAGFAPAKISNPGTGCATWIIGAGNNFSNSLREPPKPILPACQSNVFATEPQVVVFTWLDPSAFSDLNKGPQEYLIKIAEVEGNKNPYDAIAVNTVIPLFQKTVFGTSYIYTVSDPPLKKGAKYAYVISVKKDNKKYQNKGVSEVCWFTYGETPKTPEPKSSVVSAKPPKTNSGIPFTPSAVFEPIPTTVIKGKLVYAFKKTEEPKELITAAIETGAKVITFENGLKNGMFENPDFYTGTQSSSQTNSGIWQTGEVPNTSSQSGSSAPLVVGSGEYSVTQSVQGMDKNVNYAFIDVDKKIWDDAVAAVAKDAGKDRFPLSNSYVEVRFFLKEAVAKKIAQSKSINPFLKAPKNGILVGTAKTDKDGNFSITYNKGDIDVSLYNVELFVINNKQFDFPVLPIPIDLSAYGEYDLGEILGLALTFRLNVKVIGAFGKTLDKAEVKVLRTNSFYSDKTYLDPEGNRFFGGNTTTETKKENPKNDTKSDKQISSASYVGLESLLEYTKKEVVATNNTNRKFARLFEANDAAEIYLLQISNEDHKTIETPLYFLPNGDLNFSGSGTHSSTNNGVLTVSALYHLTPDKPKVLGRVIDKSTEVPVPDVTVTIFRDGKTYTTKTGKDGKFIIKNIEASSESYTLKLSGAGIKEWTDPNKLFLEQDGVKIEKDPLYVSALLIPVTGVVTDLTNLPLNNAELKWKNGGKSFYSASNGQYVGYNVAGKHTLVISKPGYKTKEIQVELTAPSKMNEKLIAKTPKNMTAETPKTIENINVSGLFGNTVLSSSNGIDYLQNTSPPKASKNTGTSGLSAALNIVASEAKVDNYLGDILTESENNYAPGITIDTIKLSQFFVKVKVIDNDTKNPIENAVVTANDEEKEFKSDVNGIAVLSNVPEGSSNIFVSSPSGTNYVAAKVSVAVQPDKDTTEVEIGLSGGAKLSGKVTSAGKNIADAEVFVEGKSYIKTKSDGSGNYTVAVPVGEYTIFASKSGLVADKKTIVFEKKDYTQDFELKDPGFDASKILGFDLILYDSKPEATPNEFKISGAITHVPSNTLFPISNSKKLEFIDQIVVKQGSNIVPKSGTLKLADAQLDFKLFDYLNVNLKKTGGIKVIPVGDDITKGIITGDLFLDVSKTLGNKYGLTWPGGDYKLLNGSSAEFNAFYSNATSVITTALKLNAPSSGWDIYGVKLTPDFNNTVVDKDGISFAGSIDLKDVPGLGSTTLALKTFQIGTNGDIKKLEINLTPNPEINFLSWKMVLKNISINQYGLRFGGNLNIPIPGSDAAVFEFNDVNVSKSGLNGGTYKLKGSINFFDVAEFKGIGSNPLSFGKIPGTDNYKINGGGSINFSQYLNKSVDIKDFMVTTGGDFGFTAAPNLNFDFAGGLATFKLNGLGFYPTKKEFSVDGGFGLAIPGIGGAINSSIHYTKSKVTIDKLGLSASMGGIGGFTAEAEFKGDVFGGKGKLNIAGVTEMGMGFEYKKSGSGKSISASISTGIAVPVGVVTFENIGGGFSYKSAESKYGVNLTGRMVLAPGTSAVIALEKINIGVEASPPGPVFLGSAEPSVLSMNVGHAEFKFDVPQKSFYITATLGKSLNIIPGVGMSASGGFMLAASAKSSDPYWLLGVYTKMNMLGLFNENLNITGAWSLNRAAHPEFNDYTLFIPDTYLNGGKINGIHTAFKSLKGRMSDNPYCNGVAGIAELCAYAYADMDLKIHSNFASGTYGFDVSQKWGAGGSANFFGVGVAGADVSIGFGLNGAYGGSNWTINGNGSAAAKAYVGCSGGGCGNGLSWGCCFDPCFWDSCEICPCPCGGKICIHPSVNAGYSSATGKFNVDMNW